MARKETFQKAHFHTNVLNFFHFLTSKTVMGGNKNEDKQVQLWRGGPSKRLGCWGLWPFWGPEGVVGPLGASGAQIPHIDTSGCSTATLGEV